MTALIIVDLQVDFFPGGALAIFEGDKVLPVVNQLLDLPFKTKIASQDFHPPNHVSFAKRHRKKVGEIISVEGVNQALWPPHCVMGTLGAELVPGFAKEKLDRIIYKGSDPDCDSYSIFFDNLHKKESPLFGYLQKEGIEHIVVAGLATDYCVKESVLDALDLGLKVTVIKDGCKGLDGSKNALHLMQEKGAAILSLKEFIGAT